MASPLAYPSAAQLTALRTKLQEQRAARLVRNQAVLKLARQRHRSEAQAQTYQTQLARACHVERVFEADLWQRYYAWLGHRDYPITEREIIERQLRQDFYWVSRDDLPSMADVDLACTLLWEYGLDVSRLALVLRVWKLLQMMVGDVRSPREQRHAAQALCQALAARLTPSVQYGLKSPERAHIWLPAILKDYADTLPTLKRLFDEHAEIPALASALHAAYPTIEAETFHTWFEPPDDDLTTPIARTPQTLLIHMLARWYQVKYNTIRTLLSDARHA